MSKVALSGNASGTGTLTIAAPNTNTDRTLTLPDNSGTVLTSASTGGVSQAMLAAGVAGNGPAFSATQSSGTALSNSVYTKLLFDTKEFDTNTNYSTSTSRFTPTVAGYYQVTANAAMASAGGTLNIRFYKNGSVYKAGTYTGGASWIQGTALVYMNGTTDYLEAYVYLGGSISQNTAPQSDGTYFQGHMVRAA